MIFDTFPKYAARNAAPVLEAFAQGLARHTATVSDHGRQGDVAVLWSQLWAGRMKPNQDIYRTYRDTGRSVVIIDVGTIRRNQTWRIVLDNNAHLAGHGHDHTRRRMLGLDMQPWTDQGQNIVIGMQRSDSNQWHGMPDTNVWLDDIVSRLRMYTQRPIVIRSHPRSPLTWHPHNTVLRLPKHIPGTYDDFDFPQCLNDAWAVVNWNSTPGIVSVLQGVPAFVGPSSLAAPVANTDLAFIESPRRPDREQWANDLAWTEWTVEEICRGEPQKFLLDLMRNQ